MNGKVASCGQRGVMARGVGLIQPWLKELETGISIPCGPGDNEARQSPASLSRPFHSATVTLGRFVIQFAIRDAAGKATAPRTKAKGHATMAFFGQVESQRAVGPRAINDIMPDMDTAMMAVIMTWVRIRVFLSIVGSFNGGQCRGVKTRQGHHPVAGWCRGFTSESATKSRVNEDWNNRTSLKSFRHRRYIRQKQQSNAGKSALRGGSSRLLVRYARWSAPLH